MSICVSIIVPIYNAEMYLEQCINSIRNQTYQNLQIILVDDGSEDASLALCHHFAALDKRIEVIHQANGGVVSARKAGVLSAKGEMIGWVDADDWIEPDWIELLVNRWKETNADIIAAAHFHDIGPNSTRAENKLMEGVYERKEILSKMLYTGEFFEYGILPHLVTKLIRREILQKTQLNVDDRIVAGDDAAVVYPSILEADRICVSGICGYHYVQRTGSITKREYAGEKVRVKTLIDYLMTVFAEKKVLHIMRKQMDAYKMYLLALRQISVFDEYILTPFGGIAYGSRIVIYGAGVLGQKIYQYIKSCGKAEICCWLDRNWEVYQENGFPVDRPERIVELKNVYDYVIIANINRKSAFSMNEYMRKFGVDSKKIRWFSDEFLHKIVVEGNAAGERTVNEYMEERAALDITVPHKIAVYGAKSIALGIFKALEQMYPFTSFVGFVVTSNQNNPKQLSGQKVLTLEELKQLVPLHERERLTIFIGTPEDIHKEIAERLLENGFFNFVFMDSKKEAVLIERYFAGKGIFPSIHSLKAGEKKASLQIYQAKFYRDKVLKSSYPQSAWVKALQVGAALTDVRVAEDCDCFGENISEKNGNYCELTGLYWMWKNRLNRVDEKVMYYGLYHYRRVLDIQEEDLRKIYAEDVDVVLPFPTLHEPDIREHHARYMKEEDWQVMLQALRELHPEYMAGCSVLLEQPYLYNYNLILAKKHVLNEYCAWLFPVLERVEELSSPKGWERSDRYIGYLGENLMTLYFLYHQNRLKIYHTGRIMLT